MLQKASVRHGEMEQADMRLTDVGLIRYLRGGRNNFGRTYYDKPCSCMPFLIVQISVQSVIDLCRILLFYTQTNYAVTLHTSVLCSTHLAI